MTLKDSIDLTLEKHPNSSCYEVLGLYFALPKLFNRLNETQKKDIEVKLSKEGCIKTAFTSGPARDFIKNLSKSDVINMMRKELSLPFTWTGSIESLVDIYAKKYGQIRSENEYDNVHLPNNDFEEFRLCISNLLQTYSEYAVKQILIQNNNDPKINAFITKGAEYIKNNNAKYYALNDYEAFMLFANSKYNFYSNYEEELTRDDITKSKRDMDSLMSMNVNNSYKAHALYELYTGSGNLLQYLPNKIDAKSVKLNVLDDAVRASIVNLDFQEQYRQRELYGGLSSDKIEQIMYRLNNIVEKLTNKNYEELGFNSLNITNEELLSSLDLLDDTDIKFLCELYVKLNTNPKAKEILRNADNKTSYLMPSDEINGSLRALSDEDIRRNANRYSNLVELLQMVESKDFIDNLDNKYYI